MKGKMMYLMLVLTLVFICLMGCSKSEGTNGNATEGKGNTTDSNTLADINEDGTVNNPEAIKIDKDKLVFWSLFSGGDGGFLDEIIKNYNATSPTKQVQSIMLVWADYYTKLQTAVAVKKGPDIGVSHVSKLPELVDQGVVVALDDILEELGVDLTTLYSQNSIDSVTFDGKIYGIPLDTHAEILYFNNDILKQAGISLNAEGKLDIQSVSDFKAILDQIKAVLPEGYSTVSLSNQGDDPYRIWWATYYQLGGTALVNDAGTEVSIDEEKAMEAAVFVKSLFDEGYVKEGIDDHQAFFQSGKSAIAFCGTWAVGAFEKTDGLNFGCQAFPKLYQNTSCWADSHILIIPTKDSRSKEDTKASIEFILGVSGDGGVTWAQSGQIPSNTKVLESVEFKELAYRNNYKSALTDAVLPTKNANFYAMKAGMIESLNSYWTNQADVKEAIDLLVSELETNLN